MDRIESFEEYQKEALVTASMGKGREMEGFVRVCGLVGEAGELFQELRPSGDAFEEGAAGRIIKELGDVLWYAATLAKWLGLSVHFDFTSIEKWNQRCCDEAPFGQIILVRAAKLAELMKKHLGHDKPMADFKGKELELMFGVIEAIGHVSHVVGLDLGHVAAINIAKLRARHNGGGFTAAAQNAKADELPVK